MGSKSSRHNLDNSEPLSKETIEELCHDTGFTEDELLKLHTDFYKDCPDGKLTLKQFENEYSRIMGKPKQKTLNYIRHMFNVYDQDKSQFIDFREFVIALSAVTVVNRLRLIETLFSIFDLDNDGKITKDEIDKMLHTLVDVTNSNKRHNISYSNEHDLNKQHNLQRRIDDAFNALNTNDDDHITKDEFIEWYMKSDLLSDVSSNEINTSNKLYFQERNKKYRKIKNNQFNSNKNKESNRQQPQIIYMSQMTERQLSLNTDDNDEGIDNKTTTTTTMHRRINLDNTNLHYSKGNRRWEYLFNSVFKQIHGQISDDEQQKHINLNDHSRINYFHLRKQQHKENFKLDNNKQKSNDGSSSPDIISVRF
ncbi:unnamed protein product [Rotaria sordida]|uniref:EF-hand domain-containing protein n=1 Tax=Rotaria sordida TaxID=392033 RepID=A0A814HRI0_9BILA|nr:unnamed protein product [Rotaria sordida]